MSVTEILPPEPSPRGSIAARVRAFVLDNFYVTEPEKLADGDSLLATGVVDSTGFLEIIGSHESAFDVSIADAELVPANFETIERIAAFVSRKLARPE